MSNSADSSSELESRPDDSGDDVLDLTEEVEAGTEGAGTEAGDETSSPSDADIAHARTAEVASVDQEHAETVEGGDRLAIGRETDEMDVAPEAASRSSQSSDEPGDGERDDASGSGSEVPTAAVLTPRNGRPSVDADAGAGATNKDDDRSDEEAVELHETVEEAESVDPPDDGIDEAVQTLDEPLPSNSSVVETSQPADGRADTAAQPVASGPSASKPTAFRDTDDGAEPSDSRPSPNQPQGGAKTNDGAAHSEQSVPSDGTDSDSEGAEQSGGRDAPAAALQTVRMEPIDRGAIEREGQYQQLEQTLPLVSSRFASEIVVKPPRVLVTRWRDGVPGSDARSDAPSRARPGDQEREPGGADAAAGDSKEVETPTIPPTAKDDGSEGARGAQGSQDESQPAGSGEHRAQTAPPDQWRPPNAKKSPPNSPPDSASPPNRPDNATGPRNKPPPPDTGGRPSATADTGPQSRPPTKPEVPDASPSDSDEGAASRSKRITAPQRPQARDSDGAGAPGTGPAPPAESTSDGEIDDLVDEIIEDGEAMGLEEPTGPPNDGDWVQRVFGDEFLLSLPPGLPQRTREEADFIEEQLDLSADERMLDLACGWGRHTIELSKRGHTVVGFDLSKPLLQKALNEANRQSLDINYFHGDMREMDFEGVFDHVVCWGTSFGYFDDATNRDVLRRIHRALDKGGRLLLDVTNRDYLVRDMPHREWWEGAECLFLEEGEFDYSSSIFHMNRSFIFEDGRPPIEHDYYVRIYALHELRRLLKSVGFEIAEISGGIHYPGYFLGAESPEIIIEARKP